MTRDLLSRGREEFLKLLKAADPLDCGDSATREIYGFGVGDLAAHFLGEGDWGWTRSRLPVSTTEPFSTKADANTRKRFETSSRRSVIRTTLSISPRSLGCCARARKTIFHGSDFPDSKSSGEPDLDTHSSITRESRCARAGVPCRFGRSTSPRVPVGLPSNPRLRSGTCS